MKWMMSLHSSFVSSTICRILVLGARWPSSAVGPFPLRVFSLLPQQTLSRLPIASLCIPYHGKRDSPERSSPVCWLVAELALSSHPPQFLAWWVARIFVSLLLILTVGIFSLCQHKFVFFANVRLDVCLETLWNGTFV